jgi:glycosyltransferase involved in cell wall biosynthesis
MSDPGRYALIVTYNRPQLLVRCVEAIRDQVDLIMIVDNSTEDLIRKDRIGAHVMVMRYQMQPPNLSLFWNMGLRAIEHTAHTRGQKEWDVAVLNDDAIPPPGWFVVVSDAIRKHNAVAGCSGGPTGSDPVVYGPEAQPAVHTRLAGWAFVLRGEHALRADERFKWWCGDDDLSMQARNAGGLVVVPGMGVPNTEADSTTVGTLMTQSAIDMQSFVDKWGKRPW